MKNNHIEVTREQWFKSIDDHDVVTLELTRDMHKFKLRNGEYVGYRLPGYDPSLGPKRYFLSLSFIRKYEKSISPE